MTGMFKVICSCKGSRVESKSFKDFDLAFDYAEKQMYDFGYTCLILQLNFETAKWFKRVVLYPKG